MTVAIPPKRVVFISNLQENLYENLLIHGLAQNKFDVKSVTSSHFIFLPRVFKWGRFDILHLHDVIHVFLAADSSIKRWIKFGLLIFQLFIIRLSGIQTVWTIHEWVDKTGGKWGDIHPVWLKIISYLLDGVISHSRNTMDAALQGLSFPEGDPASVIMHGNYIGAYENQLDAKQARQKLEIPQDSFVFLLFGNILRSKGFLEAIHAFQALDRQDAHLLIVGFPGEDGIEDDIIAEIEGWNTIQFIPKKVPNHDIQIYMNACNSVVLPYKVYTTSGVAMLAMSFAKSCIVPKVGYFTEVLDEKGAFFYEPEATLGLQTAMAQAIGEQRRTQEMGQYNYTMAQQWSWDYVAAETAKLYRRVLNGDR